MMALRINRQPSDVVEKSFKKSIFEILPKFLNNNLVNCSG